MCNTTIEAGAAMDAEVRALRAERDEAREALDCVQEEIGCLRDAKDRMPVLLGALTTLEHAFRRGNFRETDDAMAGLWADYCAAAQGAHPMTTPKLWPQLVNDAKDRDISRWLPGEITAAVREANEAWVTQVEASDAELIKYIDLYIFMERDRDQCARERDAYKAERDALAARVAAYEAALRIYADTDNWAYAGHEDLRTWIADDAGCDLAWRVLEASNA